MIKIGYEKQESSLFGVIFRPVAEIYLKKKGEEKRYKISTIIDSGADVTLLPGMYAGILGVDLKECTKQKTRGIGGFADIYITKMEARIGSEEIRTFVGFIEGDIPPLMGRTDFFRKFEIYFKTNEILFISEGDEDA